MQERLPFIKFNPFWLLLAKVGRNMKSILSGAPFLHSAQETSVLSYLTAVPTNLAAASGGARSSERPPPTRLCLRAPVFEACLCPGHPFHPRAKTANNHFLGLEVPNWLPANIKGLFLYELDAKVKNQDV